MNVRAFVYTICVTLAVAGTAAISVALYRDGSMAVSGWTDAVLPGPLSDKHAFLSEKCESCHTQTKGIEAAACISCHTTAAADLGKQSTAFHATSKECRGCHTEHLGGARPIKMDHAMLLQIGAFSQGQGRSVRQISEQMAADLKEVLGLPKSDEREKTGLDCANCHSNREPHRGLFGRDCVSCHELDSWRIARFLHPSAAST
jgi:hypothetical protein